MNLRKAPLGSALALVLTAAALAPTCWAAAPKSGSDKERELISLLKSSAPEGDKAIACKKLAIYGSEDAVEVLAPLLENERLASWARIALEAIPGRAADKALRAALPKLKGPLLVGAVNSIGIRRDADAVSPLKKLLQDPNNEVVSASAVALGRIGGKSAAAALKNSLVKSDPGTRSGVAEGCVLCAEHFLADGRNSAAIELYDAVRKASELPKQKLLDATRGAILARKDKGVPLMVESLRSPDYAIVGMALHVARELPGTEAANALRSELWQAKPERQPMLLLALADRPDGQAATAAVQALKSGSKKLQIVAVGVLERLGTAATLPELLNVATTGEPELRQAAVTALTRLPGNEVDPDLLKRLTQSSGKARVVLLELAGLRQLPGAVPLIAPLVDNPDVMTRSAALQALGILGTEKDVPKLVASLQKTSDSKARADIEGGLVSISSRVGKAAVPELLPLAKSGDAPCRIVALKALASAGGPEALSAVKAATEDSDESVQDEAVRTLSSWPNTWPEDEGVAEPLLALAGSGKKNSYQVLAVRGYLQYLQGDKKLKHEDRLTMVGQLLPLVKRPEEKRLVISTVRESHAPGLLPLLLTFTGEEAISEDACSAIVSAVGKAPAGVAKEDREKALKAVIEHSKNDATRKKAEQLLKNLK